MPPRKPPKTLMSRCMDVISNSVLDITVNIEDKVSLSTTLVVDNKTNLVEGNTKYLSKKEHRLGDPNEEEVAKYIFSSLPNTLISLLLSQIMKEFATRWRTVIDISENKLDIPNTNGIR